MRWSEWQRYSTADERPATASQLRAIHAIANRNRIDLTARLREMFTIEQPTDLSLSEASQVIGCSQVGQLSDRFIDFIERSGATNGATVIFY